MSFTIQSSTKNPKGTIQLTGSKSESNRALIIKSLCPPGKVELSNLSAAKDTFTLQEILSRRPRTADVGPAGTAMRFLAARLTLAKGSTFLTGSDRMKERPIGILVDALQELGANIRYAEKEGFPPLQVTGGTLRGGCISIDGSVSSQFISALCLIAPTMQIGLTLHFMTEIASKPYLDMTLSMMEYFGIEHTWTGPNLSIQNQTYTPKKFTIEPDWSAASYWYAIAALSDSAEFTLPNLKKQSLQGDAAVAGIFEQFGVSTEFTPKGITITKNKNAIPSDVTIDCEKCPDLAQTFATTIAGLGISGTLTGLKSLRIKETDRITALIAELAKFGITATELPDFVLKIEAGKIKKPTQEITTYEDHRMAMAFAPLVLKVGTLTFDDPSVVVKSYPNFWKDLEKGLEG